MQPRLCLLVAVLAAGLSTPALAGGLFLYELGAEDNGLANAGAAARAQDAATIATNPAGLTRLQGTHVMVNGGAIWGRIKFDADSNSTAGGGSGDNAAVPAPLGSVFISHQLNDRWSTGFGIFGAFGLGLDYGDKNWAGRYFSQEATISGIFLAPSVAYKIDDQWSVGVNLLAVKGDFASEMAVNRLLLADGRVKYEAEDWGYGASIGVLYQHTEQTRFGLTYNSEVEWNFDDKLKSQSQLGILPGAADLAVTMRMPQNVTLSAFHQLDSQWAVLASANWQDWSRFGEMGIDLTTSGGLIDTSRTVNRKYQDTWHLSLGTQYQMTDKLRLNAGIGYDSSAVQDKHRTVDNPMGEIWRFATGFMYQLDADTSVHASYTLAWMGDMQVDQQRDVPGGNRVSGEYKRAHLSIIGAGINWAF